MTKAEIARAMQLRLRDISKKETTELVELVFETMKEMLGRGEMIGIEGFGTFMLRDKGRRQGRNPQTRGPMVLSERRVVSFTARRRLRRILNAPPEVAEAAEE